jgi:triacylglycerol lipase
LKPLRIPNEETLSIWGSGNGFVVYTNSSEMIYEKILNSKTIFYWGEDNQNAGDKSIEEQAMLLHKKIQILQENKNLGKKFSIIARSMGGLVDRRYIYKNPDVVNRRCHSYMGFS